MARYCPLFSGSTGNCTYIGTAEAGVLIDAGVSARRIETALSDRELDIRRVAAIFVTHEHNDHTAGLRILQKRYGIPLYATAGTLSGMVDAGIVDAAADLREMPDAVAAGGMEISCFRTPHDAVDSCGYRLRLPDGRSVAVATDMGCMWPSVREMLEGCDLVHIESNHDVRMLETGRYPYPLKRRILSDFGHLSNDACAAELPGLVRSGTTRIVLAHLSQDNNAPYLASATAEAALEQAGMQNGCDFLLRVAAPACTEAVTVF